MSTKGTADVVFCLDVSDSMQPCVEAVKRHVVDFVTGLEHGSQGSWDLRVDFVAHRAGDTPTGTVYQHRSLKCKNMIEELYWKDEVDTSKFFTSDLDEFAKGVNGLEVFGDEATLVAVDCCLDFPWRSASNCHRVVIVLTDEPVETGVNVTHQREAVERIVEKIQELRVMLFVVAPDSEIFEDLASADRSEYEVVDEEGDGLAHVKFGDVFRYIGKSVSVSNFQLSHRRHIERGIFGQPTWRTKDAKITGR